MEPRLKVVVRACYGAYFVAQVFKYLAPNFVCGRPARSLPNFCTIKCGTSISQFALEKHFVCFNSSV